MSEQTIGYNDDIFVDYLSCEKAHKFENELLSIIPFNQREEQCYQDQKKYKSEECGDLILTLIEQSAQKTEESQKGSAFFASNSNNSLTNELTDVDQDSTSCSQEFTAISKSKVKLEGNMDLENELMSEEHEEESTAIDSDRLSPAPIRKPVKSSKEICNKPIVSKLTKKYNKLIATKKSNITILKSKSAKMSSKKQRFCSIDRD